MKIFVFIALLILPTGLFANQVHNPSFEFKMYGEKILSLNNNSKHINTGYFLNKEYYNTNNGFSVPANYAAYPGLNTSLSYLYPGMNALCSQTKDYDEKGFNSLLLSYSKGGYPEDKNKADDKGPEVSSSIKTIFYLCALGTVVGIIFVIATYAYKPDLADDEINSYEEDLSTTRWLFGGTIIGLSLLGLAISGLSWQNAIKEYEKKKRKKTALFDNSNFTAINNVNNNVKKNINFKLTLFNSSF